METFYKTYSSCLIRLGRSHIWYFGLGSRTHRLLCVDSLKGGAYFFKTKSSRATVHSDYFMGSIEFWLRSNFNQMLSEFFSTTLTEVFRAFSSTVRQMPGYNSPRRGTTRTLKKLLCLYMYFFLFCIVLCIFCV